MVDARPPLRRGVREGRIWLAAVRSGTGVAGRVLTGGWRLQAAGRLRRHARTVVVDVGWQWVSSRAGSASGDAPAALRCSPSPSVYGGDRGRFPSKPSERAMARGLDFSQVLITTEGCGSVAGHGFTPSSGLVAHCAAGVLGPCPGGAGWGRRYSDLTMLGWAWAWGLSRGGKGGAFPPVPLVIGGCRSGAGAGSEPWMPRRRPWMACFTVGSLASNVEAGVGGVLRSCGWRGARCGHGEAVAGGSSGSSRHAGFPHVGVGLWPPPGVVGRGEGGSVKQKLCALASAVAMPARVAFLLGTALVPSLPSDTQGENFVRLGRRGSGAWLSVVSALLLCLYRTALRRRLVVHSCVVFASSVWCVMFSFLVSF